MPDIDDPDAYRELMPASSFDTPDLGVESHCLVKYDIGNKNLICRRIALDISRE